MSAADAFAARLASGVRIDEAIGIVVAHPDDETLWAGAALARLPRAVLVHVTDGAPLDMEVDATRLGFATRGDYAAVRAGELDRALAALEFRGRRIDCGIPDQEAVRHLSVLADRLVRDLAGVAAIVTHPFEGGHPDHDACAWACAQAAERLGVPLVEFACYHQAAGVRVFGAFWADTAEHERVLDLDDRARVDAACRAHASQSHVFGAWRPEVERWRAAPAYDFGRACPPGWSLYDGFGWTMTSDVWRTCLPPSRSAPAGRPSPGMGQGRKLTVLSVAYGFAPVTADPAGGSEQVVAALDRALVEAGHRSIVVACDGSSVAGELRAVPACRGPVEGGRAGVHAAMRARIGEAIAADGPDLVHLHGIDFDAYLPADGPPVLATLHLPLDWYGAGALRPERRRTFLQPVSADQAARAPAGLPLIAPVPNGIDTDLYRPAPKGDFALVIGRMAPEKGFHDAIDAARLAGMPLVAAGKLFGYADHWRYFEEQVVPRLDRERRFVGPVGGAAKRRLLARARCVLIPSTAAETSSLVAMEALASGTPVIAYRAGALPDIVAHGVTGFLVDDVAGMAAAIGRVGMIDPGACRAAAEARFSFRQTSAAYLDLYARLAA